MSEGVSPCCSSRCDVKGEAMTHWYACSKCGKPCDPVPNLVKQMAEHLSAFLVCHRLADTLEALPGPAPSFDYSPLAREVIRLMEWSRHAAPITLHINLGSAAPPLSLPPSEWKP